MKSGFLGSMLSTLAFLRVNNAQSLASITPVTVDIKVASKDGNIISDGALLPADARKPIIVAGIN